MFCALFSVSYLGVQTLPVVHIDTYREVISVKEIEELKKVHVIPRNVGKPNIVRSHCPTPRWRPLQMPINGYKTICWYLLHDPISFSINSLENLRC